MVITKEAQRQQEEAEKEAQTRDKINNSAAAGAPSGGQSIEGETIEYVNENA